MSHRPGDVYEFVATKPVDLGSVRAFNVGDPVPASTVETYELEDFVVTRDEWEKHKPEEDKNPQAGMTRGEMPPHLRDKPVARKTTTAGKKSDG